MTTTVDNGKSQGNQQWNTSGGNNTQDKVFQLSYAEAREYFKNDSNRKCVPTDYAVKQGVYTSNDYKVDGKATCWWWLRSLDDRTWNGAADVFLGDLLYYYSVNYTSGAVRPAIWLNLESGI